MYRGTPSLGPGLRNGVQHFGANSHCASVALFIIDYDNQEFTHQRVDVKRIACRARHRSRREPTLQAPP